MFIALFVSFFERILLYGGIMGYCYAEFEDRTEFIRYYKSKQPVCNMPYHLMDAGINAQGRRYYTDRCGHDMLFVCLTLSGQGSVICGDECHLLLPGDLLILDCMEAHYYRSESDCWRFLWFQTTGPAIHGLFRVLAPKGILYRHMRDTTYVHDLYHRFIPLLEEPSPLGNIEASERIEGFLYWLARREVTEQDAPLPSEIHQCLDYIRDHLHEDITVEDLATRVNYNAYYFIHLFKKHLGISPYYYIQSLRLHKAAALLQSTEQSISAIAQAVNFSDASRFAAAFRKRYGVTPLRYRKECRSRREEAEE